MIQKIKIFDENNPFNYNEIELNVPNKTKVYSNEPYVEELFNLYNKYN